MIMVCHMGKKLCERERGEFDEYYKRDDLCQ